MNGKLLGLVVLLTLLGTACSVGTVTDRAGGEVPIPDVTLSQSEAEPPHSSTAGVVEDVLPSVVNVRVQSLSGGGIAAGQGSGVVIDRKGIILTNAHVVQGSFDVDVFLAEDGRGRLKGEVVGTAPEKDIAVIKVDADDLEPITLGRSSKLKLGDSVVAIGFPLGLGGPTVTSGIISGEERSIEPQNGPTLEGLLQTDAAINPGNSGGPLVDMNGRLVGINTAAASAAAAENIGFAIAIDAALPTIREILEKPAEQRAWLGVFIEEVDSSAIAAQLGLDPDTRGVLIQEVVPDGPAEKAGLRPGEVIVEVADEDVRSFGDLTEALADHSPEEEITVRVVNRDGERVVDVVLGQRPVDLPTPEG